MICYKNVPEAETFFRIYFMRVEDRYNKIKSIDLGEEARHTFLYNLRIVLRTFEPQIGRKI